MKEGTFENYAVLQDSNRELNFEEEKEKIKTLNHLGRKSDKKPTTSSIK